MNDDKTCVRNVMGALITRATENGLMGPDAADYVLAKIEAQIRRDMCDGRITEPVLLCEDGIWKFAAQGSVEGT